MSELRFSSFQGKAFQILRSISKDELAALAASVNFPSISFFKQRFRKKSQQNYFSRYLSWLIENSIKLRKLRKFFLFLLNSVFLLKVLRVRRGSCMSSLCEGWNIFLLKIYKTIKLQIETNERIKRINNDV